MATVGKVKRGVFLKKCYLSAIVVIIATLLPFVNIVKSSAKTIIPGESWLQTYGVDVLTGKQCVELPQIRLYPKFDWPDVWAKVKAGTKYNGGAAYIPEGSPGLVRYNPGQGYVPVPGDLVIENPHGNNPYGHVAVVDYYANNIIYTVEQNASSTGRHNYLYNNSYYTGGYGTVKAILHAPQNIFQNTTPVFDTIKYPKKDVYITKGSNKKIHFTVYGSKYGYGNIELTKSDIKNVIGSIAQRTFVNFNKKTILRVSGKKKGTLTITYILPNGVKKDVKVHVMKKPKMLKSIKKIIGSSKLVVGQKSYYTWKLSPKNVTNVVYKYFTKGKKIKVDSNGMVTALKKGKTYLYLKIEGKIAKLPITVY